MTRQQDKASSNGQEDFPKPSSFSASPLSPAITLLIENPSKSKNWGPLLRCCSAFGVSRIFVVGYDQCNVQGSHGASNHVELVAFQTHQAAVDFLTRTTPCDDEENSRGTFSGGFELVGLLNGLPQRRCGAELRHNVGDDSHEDIVVGEHGYPVVREDIIDAVTGETKSFARADLSSNSDATEEEEPQQQQERGGVLGRTFPVQFRNFARRTCLVVDRRPGVLPWSLAQHCTRFLHIPHYGGCIGTDSTSWVTMEACVSIVLHEFSEAFEWHHSTTYQGQKYSVEQIYKGGGSRDSAVAIDKQEKRLMERQELQDEAIRIEEERLESPLSLFQQEHSFINGLENSDY